MKPKLTYLLQGLFLIFLGLNLGCTDDKQLTKCSKAGAVVHTIDNAEGSVVFDSNLDAFLVRYFVPGTIDSFWTGLVCGEVPDNFVLEDDTRVIFSGNFKDDQESIETTIQFGGEEYFYLELTSIQKGS